MEKNKGNVTYNEVIYIHNLFNQLSILKIDAEIRGDIYKLKKELPAVLQDFQEEKTFILLLNGGIEKKDSQGATYFDEPEYQIRKEFKGEDKEYKEHLIEVKTIKRTLFNLITELGDSTSNLIIKGFMTDKQFDALLELIQTSDFESLRDRLVKSNKEYKDLKVA